MKTSRRKFLGFIGAVTASVAFMSRLINKDKKPKIVKMLTQDGRLVEVDISRIPDIRVKATNDQVANWIWKNQKS